MIKQIKNIVYSLRNDFHFVELFKGSISSFSGKLIGMIFGYIAVLFIANKYGSESLGFYSISLTVLSMTVLIPKFGFDNSLIKILNEIRLKGRKKNFISTINKTVLIITSLALILSIILYFSASQLAIKIFKNSELEIYLKLVSFIVVPTSLLTVPSAYFQSFKQTFYHMLFKTSLLNVIFVLLLAINFYLFNIGENIILLYSGATILVFFISILFFKKSINKKKFNENQYFEYNTLGLINESYPMLFSNSFALLLGWVNILFLGYFMNESQVGIYDSTERLAALTNMALIAINSIVAPKFAEANSLGNLDQLKQVSRRSTQMIFITTAPILFILIFFGDSILSFFGTEFIVGYWALFFLCIGRFVSSISGPVGYLLQMTGRQKIFQNVIFMAVIVNIILSLLLIPKYGFVGAAVSKCIAIIFWNVVLVLIIKKQFGFWTIYIPFLRHKN